MLIASYGAECFFFVCIFAHFDALGYGHFVIRECLKENVVLRFSHYTSHLKRFTDIEREGDFYSLLADDSTLHL